MKTRPNWLLNSGKDSYGWWDLNFKKSWKFIKPLFWNRKYWCQGALFSWFWKGEKMDFSWYLLKKRFYDLIDVWKKLMILSDLHLKYFCIWVKIDKNIDILDCVIFFRPHSTLNHYQEGDKKKPSDTIIKKKPSENPHPPTCFRVFF